MDDYSRGCLLGLACGDAAGAVLEFKPRVSPKEAEAAMRMPGGGRMQWGPGACSDDTELAICVWRSCMQGKYSQDSAATEYSNWYREDGGPADIGGTCRFAFEKNTLKSAAEMMADSAKFNRSSQANGALMRIAPLAVCGAKNNIPVAQIAFDARQDAILSHPHPICQESNVAFVVAIMHLLKVRGDVAGAHKAAVKAISNPDVLQWINDAMAGIDPGPVVQHAGHVKHALSLAFYHLGKRSRYRDAIFDVLCRGGDCDTSGAIVGAMIGALWGVKDIPAYMLDPVLKFDCTAVQDHEMGHRRPAKYSVTRAFAS
jgi:ADP-ribosyl-[dinitrogen reductase] hydrolase